MKVIGNILWVLLVGIASTLLWYLAGLILCITIIGIPFGTQCFKIGTACFAPIGKTVVTNFDSHPVANILWLLLFGWETALGYLVSGIILCITIIGIPFGRQCFKLMKIALLPFGAKITNNK